jgi:hypothetical protein
MTFVDGSDPTPRMLIGPAVVACAAMTVSRWSFQGKILLQGHP